jgi:hypothetical protein
MVAGDGAAPGHAKQKRGSRIVRETCPAMGCSAEVAETPWTDVRCYVHETERVNHALSTSAGVPIERRCSGDFNIIPSGRDRGDPLA